MSSIGLSHGAATAFTVVPAALIVFGFLAWWLAPKIVRLIEGAAPGGQQ